jgi:hypothetical protein
MGSCPLHSFHFLEVLLFIVVRETPTSLVSCGYQNRPSSLCKHGRDACERDVQLVQCCCSNVFSLNLLSLSNISKVIAFAAFGSLFSGYGLAVVGPTLGQPTFYSSLNLVADPTLPGYSHTSTIIGAANGVFFAAGFFGTLQSGYCGDKFGRVNSFRIAATIGIIGGIIQTAAVDQAMVRSLSVWPQFHLMLFSILSLASLRVWRRVILLPQCQHTILKLLHLIPVDLCPGCMALSSM